MSATDSEKSATGLLTPAAEGAANGASVVSNEKQYVQVHSATVRFAGDSGDGMQVVGSQFADIASMTGLAVCTQPDYPSEIRAPAGSLGGVSGFQLSFADHAVHTPGDSPYVLVAMNPAALKVNLREVQPGGILIVNEDEFTEANLAKAGYAANPLTTERACCLSGDSGSDDPNERRGGTAFDLDPQRRGPLQELLCLGIESLAL